MKEDPHEPKPLPYPVELSTLDRLLFALILATVFGLGFRLVSETHAILRHLESLDVQEHGEGGK